MSLDVYLTAVRKTEVFSRNITHNLTEMADAAGLYDVLWRPKEYGIKKAADLIGPLTEGLARLKAGREKFDEFNPKNGWGSYDGLVRFCEEYLAACEENPDAEVEANR